ncbi:serine/threonine-protein kinase pim-2 [Gigaspora margarita]|uniref:Serine/threonine-protein kinase pim-2 n=1 Tax=Gigaspora margarita TaxID=4874 RepID=A0A8H4B0U0_GIGMA|nr:serine/threonine-protein kinase pim-2 [Gigaspora margarita]
MNVSSHVSLKKKFTASSQECIDKTLECTKCFDLKYLLTSNGQIIKLNKIFDWFSELDKDEKFTPIRINQITPLYKVLDYKLQNEVEIVLENRLDSRILLTGIETFDIDDNSTETHVRINFNEQSVLNSRSYDVFGLIFDNKNIRSEECVIRFDLFDCYGFSAFVSIRNNIEKNTKECRYILWFIIGKPSLVGTFSANHREINIAHHKTLVDLATCDDDVIYIPLPFTLAKNCVSSFAASYTPSNDPPKQNFKLLKWSKDVLVLKITAFDMDKPQPLQFYLNICIIYPCETMAFNVDIGEKLVAYNLFGDNLDVNDYDQFIDFNCYKNNYLNCLNVEFPIKSDKYLCPSKFGYWTFATSASDDSQLVIKYIIKKRLPNLIQSHDIDIPFEAYFMQDANHENLLRYLKIIETDTAFLLITELSLCSANWETLHNYLNHNGALSENQAKNIFKQVIECIYFIYKQGCFKVNINDKNILISGSQIKLFNLEHLVSDETNEDLVYDIQYEDDYSIAYASPEMISGHNYNPEVSDLWSLGILLYTMIHAFVPFNKAFDTMTSTLVILKLISKECTTIIHRLLAKKPHLRGTFKDLSNDPWIDANNFSRKASNNLKGNVNRNMIIEKTLDNKMIRELDELIEESQNNTTSSLALRWIPVNSLNDIKSIGKGGFGSIFSAAWVNPSQISSKGHYWKRISTKVILKECSNIHEDDNLKNFLSEMRIHTKINGLWGIIDFYGIIATGRNIYDGKSRKEILSIVNNNGPPSFGESIPSFYQNMIHSCCDKDPSNRPNAQTLVNEIIDWKLNKMHHFNDKKVLVSYMTEKMAEKSQNNIGNNENMGNDENMFIEDNENEDAYSKLKSGANAFGEYLKKAADGDPEALKKVAICFLTGTDIEKDMNAAFSWCMKCFHKKIEFTNEELIPLVEYFSQDSPDLERQIRYGQLLECGLGVEKDLSKAYVVYKKAANSGHARAQFKVGRFCEKGWGREKDLKEAFQWFRKAIEQNNLEAWSHLNERYKASFMTQDMRQKVDCLSMYLSKITRITRMDNTNESRNIDAIKSGIYDIY